MIGSRFVKFLYWVAAGAAALAALAYLVMFAINWRDRNPSAAAIRLSGIRAARPAISHEKNGFVYAMGFSVPPGDDPRRIGIRRVAWLETSRPESPLNPHTDPFGGTAERPPQATAIQAFIDACRGGADTCAPAFANADPTLEAWLVSEAWLLKRYRELLAHTGWRESLFTYTTSLPSYARIMDGQKLLLLDARRLAREGDGSAARALLEADLRFWRQVLASADNLLSKMIATRALDRHFELGELVLRTIPHRGESAAFPQGWQVPISDAERSMLRCMAGEWAFSSRVMSDVAASGWVAAEDSAFDGAAGFLKRPFFKRQDTTNQYAEMYLRIAELLDAPWREYKDAAQRVTDLGEVEHAFSAYNPVGNVLTSIGLDFGPYGRRVNDIEGVRRAALAT